MSQEMNVGGPLTTQDIIKDLNNPYSRLRQDVGVYITSEYHEDQLQKQQQYLQIIRSERDQLQALSQRSGISPEAADIEEKMLSKLEPIPAQNQELLQKLQLQSQELDSLYKEYDKISQKITDIKEKQVTEYNATLNKLGLDDKYKLTPEKQTELDKSFKETEERTAKLKEMTGVTTPETKKDVLNEIKYMKVQTRSGENQNLPLAEIQTLAKGKDPDTDKSLFQMVNEAHKSILTEEKKREALLPSILSKENEVAQTAGQLNQNTAQLRPLLTPNFASSKNVDEVEKKLNEMYENYEKIHKLSGSSLNMGDAFQFHLDSQLKQMQPEERKEFFKKTEDFSPKDEKQLNIFSALENLREKYKYQPESSTVSSETPKSSAPTPFDIKPGLKPG